MRALLKTQAFLALGLAALLCLSGCGLAPGESGSAPSPDAFTVEKHGQETGCATAEEYLAAANAVIANPAALHKLQAEDGDDLYFLESTGEFVVVSPAGYIRTYYLTDRDYFERQ